MMNYDNTTHAIPIMNQYKSKPVNEAAYLILWAPNAERLQERVIEKLSMGWNVTGGLAVIIGAAGPAFYQAMTHY